MSKRLIGLSGPSSFTDHCIGMIEEFYNADLVLLYHNNQENLKRWVDRCDGIILAGGVDIHPSVYDHSIWNGQGFSKFDLKRDERELQILEWCNESKKPYFGICRGHQLIGISLGFFLLPDLSHSSVAHQASKQGISLEDTEPLHSIKISQPEKFKAEFNWQEPEERKLINRIMRHDYTESLFVNSFHHQGLAYLGARKVPEGVKVHGTARVDLHSVKEIVELMSGEHWVACQFHPEYDWRVNSASRCVLKYFDKLMTKK